MMLDALKKLFREKEEMLGRKLTCHITTMGCQMNARDSEKLLGVLTECGAVQEETENADILLFNTCTVRENANEKLYGHLGQIRHYKESHPDMLIGICGCMMQEEDEVLRIRQKYRYVDLVFGTHNIWKFPEFLYSCFAEKRRVIDVAETPDPSRDHMPVRRKYRFKSGVNIMYGCNNFCTYCIVPYVRGRERSRLPEDILAECRELIAQGYRELTLLGQNVNSYGKDLGLGLDFADLLGQIAELEGDFVLRFMTSHPRDASHKLFDVMASHDKIAKQFHLPFQSGNDRILKEMNRHYNRAQYLELIEYGRSLMPEIVFTSDVIVGFPGETEAEFEDTLSLIERVRFDALFTFIYSPRPGTPAAKLPDPTPKEEKNRRFDRLLAVQNGISEEKHRAYVGKSFRALVDGRDGDRLTARTDGGRLVRFEGDDSLMGQFVELTVTDSTTWSLVGQISGDGAGRRD